MMQRAATLFGLWLCAIAAGCAAPGAAPPGRLGAAAERMLPPRGPGAVFASVDAAAVDGLATAFLAGAGERGAARRARGGRIRAVEGGFRYGPIAVASPDQPDRVELRLDPEDVAYFHTYGGAASAADPRERRQHAADRARSARDPGGRACYVLAPRLRIWRCDAAERGNLVARIPAGLGRARVTEVALGAR